MYNVKQTCNLFYRLADSDVLREHGYALFGRMDQEYLVGKIDRFDRVNYFNKGNSTGVSILLNLFLSNPI